MTLFGLDLNCANYYIDKKKVTKEEFDMRFTTLELMFDNILLWYVPSKKNYILEEKLMLKQLKKGGI